ncbi:glycosyltransferase family 4 protein [Jannaschia seohaensis]|uniref:Glycosyltransferase involved in cell wall biosynthesis n=1 Tax=Jannaschia seohaensis TaxID=475081 RepID=A0A2Y9ASS8_9RHOB|nr:glycosyltransferase family 4 protein [Jannaschia seohaensis]PWJ17437.1 glycosyltransferase involved in cell wall biosynthesis [Jannaschia seohaensis]SSA47500.1 Glycosyltransferase involved in cell wall bisynthesis [Jannaschia seohaensis]
MKILFVHQNMPGQYREMLDWLIAQGGHELVFLTQRRNYPERPGVKKVLYAPHHRPAKDAYGLSKVWEEATGAGYGAAMAAQHLRDTGWTPDIIIGHTGWGELLFMKQVYPAVPILGFFEYFYLSKGGPVGFDPEDPPSEASPFLLHARNAVPFANLHVADRGIAPTMWQRNCFPEAFHAKLDVCHDGIRTDRLGPDPDVALTLGRVGRITRDDEIFTYIARNMERTRGFHTFMRALPHIQKARPNARVLVVGGNDASYGKKSALAGGFRAEMEREVGHLIDWDRTHFLGQVPYPDFQKIVQISRCHIYLTMPFVLSWSMLEAMAMEATIVASDVPPVREAMTDGETGLLTDFFDPPALAEKVAAVLAEPERFAHLGKAARRHVVENYDFLNVCLPRQIGFINALVPEDRRIAI